MCGITGAFTFESGKSRGELRAIVRKMRDTLTHRGPDSKGLWDDPNVSLVLGHRRLAILDTSKHGAQPMVSKSGRYVLVHNGEIFNYPELQKILKDLGHVFKGHSDTEVLLAAIEQWGVDRTLPKLHGQFAFCAWDKENRVLHFARDRMGQKPFYMGWAGKTLIFGSELKALYAHPDFRAEINNATLSLYMRHGYVPAPYCVYRQVWSLPPGFGLTLNVQDLTPGEDLTSSIQPYWSHGDILHTARGQMQNISDSDAVQDFESLLKTCTEDRMISDVPLGAFLSGGIDSSAIVALMQSISDKPVKTYTIGFQERGYDEAAHARSIAAHLRTDHHEYYVSSRDALSVIPDLPTIYDEPFADLSSIPTFLLSKFARKSVTVSLSGDGGDEMLGGYSRYSVVPKLYETMNKMPSFTCRWGIKVLETVPPHVWDKLLWKRPQAGRLIHKIASLLPIETQEGMYRRLLSVWPESPLLDFSDPWTFLDQDVFDDTFTFAERMMAGDSLFYLPNDILTKVDRASMACSLEVRSPLLDHRIYEYVWSLPLHMKIRDGQGKWLLRQVLERYVPAALFDRPKQGFGVPAGAWLRDPLRDWAEDLLQPQALREQGIMNASIVRRAWQEHLGGRRDHTEKLWAILMFQAWAKKWVFSG